MFKRLSIVLVALTWLALCQNALAQSTQNLKHFAAQGLSFDYPATIEVDDRGGVGVQHLVIQSKGLAQIMIVSRFDKISTPADLAAARREVVDPFVETVWKQMHDDDPNVARTTTQIQVGAARAPGVRMRAILNNEPGNAEVYSLQMGSRLVVLSQIGTDKEIAESAATWFAIRRSLKVIPADAAAKIDSSRRGIVFTRSSATY
jgi:hypothetical protein